MVPLVLSVCVVRSGSAYHDRWHSDAINVIGCQIVSNEALRLGQRSAGPDEAGLEESGRRSVGCSAKGDYLPGSS
jgi:hypothetical protein